MPRHIHIHVHRTRDSDEGRWVTIHGAHVFIEGGKITKGPTELVGKTEGEVKGEGGSSSGRPSGKRYSEESVRAVERKLSVIPGKEVPVERVFNHPEADPTQVLAAEKGKGKSVESIENVSLADLVPTQEHVWKKGILDYARSRGGSGYAPISAVAVGDKVYLLDGHHRVATMILAGIRTAPITVMRRKK